MTTTPTLIQLRRGTAEEWNSVNPVLADGEPGYEDDTGKLKVGDGTSAWSALEYLVGSGGGGSVTLPDFATGPEAVAGTATDLLMSPAADAAALAGLVGSYGVRHTLYINDVGAWPVRPDTTDPVEWNSVAYPGAVQPPAVEGDLWLRRKP